MKNLKSYEIRQMWLDFFKSKGHSVEQSANLIPNNDKTLLWINAGVSPLKKYFDGSVSPKNPRITNAQKCIRTNDIENVGKTARHHTFFEMLGNFSIGDYFKHEAIDFAYELLTSKDYFDISPDKLYITHYTDDLETRDLWIEHGMSSSHMVALDGNFWEIGEGPCGPDTEIFFDRGSEYDTRGVELLEQDIENDRYVEIWNIVFSQFNSKEGLAREDYPELPNKNIDTGCGLERLCCIMQDTKTNFETDLFMPIIKKIEEISGVKYEGQMAFKVIADHLRTVVFAVSDGAILSNEGRGYVLRRVLRRAIKHAGNLGLNKPFMASLVDVVVENMKGFYPYLVEKQAIVKKIITIEEEKFLQTLKNGEDRFNEAASNSTSVISGEDAFTLYDTYGFPIELTVEFAEEKNLTVDIEGFKACMQAQKERARNSRENTQSMASQNEEYLAFKEPSDFIGYDTLKCDSKIIKIFDNAVVLDKTPFYAFSGGQLCDKGSIDGVEVLNVEKMPNGQHLMTLAENDFVEGQVVSCSVDEENRMLTAKNHSCAHLLQKALQEILGNHVHQQGSQVCADYTRFDFNNYDALTSEELLEIEAKVNEYISAAHPVNTLVLTLEEAKKTRAMALFDEKYGEKVRVVDMEVSKEFCAGTHVKNTAEIEKFYITSYESIGSGIFRIQGVTSSSAQRLLEKTTQSLDLEIAALNTKAENIITMASSEGISLDFSTKNTYNDVRGYRYILYKREYVNSLSASVHELEKEYNSEKQKQALSDISKYKELINKNTLVIKVDIADSNILKDLARTILNSYNLSMVFLASVNNDKITFVCTTDKSINAGQVVKEAAKICGGGGGGKPDIAQAGGKDVSALGSALDYVKGLVK